MSVEAFKQTVEQTTPLDANAQAKLKQLFNTFTPDERFQAISILNEIIARGRTNLTTLREELAPGNSVDMDPLIISSNPASQAVTPVTNIIPSGQENQLLNWKYFVGELPEGVSLAEVQALIFNSFFPGRNVKDIRNIEFKTVLETKQAELKFPIGQIESRLYQELLIQEFLREVQGDDTKYLDPKIQDRFIEIKDNPIGTASYAFILNESIRLKNTYENDSRYEPFILKLGNSSFTDAQKNEVLVVASTPNNSGGSLLGDLMDVVNKKMTMAQYWERNKGTGIFLAIIAFIIAGDKIPGVSSLPGGGSWLGRSAYILGGAMLGGQEFIEEAFDTVNGGVDDAKAFFTSPETKRIFNERKDKTITWVSEKAKIVTGINIGATGDNFSKYLGGLQSVHTARKNAHQAVVTDENYLALSKLTDLDSFMNLRKDTVAGIKSHADLKALLSGEDQDKLTTMGLDPSDDSEIALYIQHYFLPQFGEKDEYVNDIFITYRAINTAENVIGSLVSLGAKSEKNNAVLAQSLGAILNDTTVSDDLKRAVKKLENHIKDRSVETFNLESYSSLGAETAKLKGIYEQATYIFETETKIVSYTSQVQDIVLEASGYPESEENLNNKFTALNQIQSEFTAFRKSKGGEQLGIAIENFHWNDFEVAYQTKRQEILEYAGKRKSEGGLGLNSFAGVDIAKEREISEKEKKVAELRIQSEKIISQIEDVPTVNASPVEMQDWHKDNISKFTELEKISIELGSIQVNGVAIGISTIKKIVGTSDKMADLEENYEIVREKTRKEVQALTQQVEQIKTRPAKTIFRIFLKGKKR